MNLLSNQSKELLKKYPLNFQRKSFNPVVCAKLWISTATWYILEFDEKTNIAYCYTT
jgi:hypothetical protein